MIDGLKIEYKYTELMQENLFQLKLSKGLKLSISQIS